MQGAIRDWPSARLRADMDGSDCRVVIILIGVSNLSDAPLSMDGGRTIEIHDGPCTNWRLYMIPKSLYGCSWARLDLDGASHRPLGLAGSFLTRFDGLTIPAPHLGRLGDELPRFRVLGAHHTNASVP